MFITKLSGRIFGIKGQVFRVHAACGDVLAVFETKAEAVEYVAKS